MSEPSWDLLKGNHKGDMFGYEMRLKAAIADWLCIEFDLGITSSQLHDVVGDEQAEIELWAGKCPNCGDEERQPQQDWCAKRAAHWAEKHCVKASDVIRAAKTARVALALLKMD